MPRAKNIIELHCEVYLNATQYLKPSFKLLIFHFCLTSLLAHCIIVLVVTIIDVNLNQLLSLLCQNLNYFYSLIFNFSLICFIVILFFYACIYEHIF